MGQCAQCGNDYDKSFEVRMGGRTMIFDSFECAIQALAPVCPHCGCRIIGHGVEHGDTIFCCVIAPSRKVSKAYATAIRDQTQPALCECPLWVSGHCLCLRKRTCP